jgi:hypothetical protein
MLNASAINSLDSGAYSRMLLVLLGHQQERFLNVKRAVGRSSLLKTVQMGMHGASDEREKHEHIYRRL